ncbi:MAG: HAMP domain-containing sensor histidine kinase, partial [Rubrivivax sp.]
DRLKDDFMSSVTHELRTPLASIRALAELMRDEPDMEPAQRQQFIAIVVSEAERLSRLVNQVLDMAKIEAGHAEWHTADVDLGALLEQAVQSTAELLRERGAVVELSKPDHVPLLRADPDRLLQVVLNLLSNAAKFTPPGAGRIALRLLVRPQGATVEVEDNGPGVPREQQQLVFEKFRQGGDGRRRPQGPGLGLPISRQIVEHFGGRLWLVSEPGHGARFGFDLPWRQADAGNDAPARPSQPEAEAPAARPAAEPAP